MTSDQSPTQNTTRSTASGSMDWRPEMNAGTGMPAGGGGSDGPAGGAMVLTVSAGRAAAAPGGLSPAAFGGVGGLDIQVDWGVNSFGSWGLAFWELTGFLPQVCHSSAPFFHA